MNTSNKKDIIIIGGGYAGISVIHNLKSYKELNISLVDKKSKHLLQTHIHKYLSGYYKKDDITFNHQKYCSNNNINFICDEVVDINYEKNYIVSKQNKIYNYDYLIVATGSISIFPKQIKNIIEYTKDIKNIDNLDYYRNKFLKMLKTDNMEQSIVVVGGGVSGVQIACEYAQTIKNYKKLQKNISIYLIEGMDTLLPGLDKFLRESSTKRCKELEINVITGLFASAIEKDYIVLSNGETIDYNMLIFVIGAVGNYVNNQDKNIKLNNRNQLIVDEYYRVKPYQNVFSIGDVVEALDVKTNQFQAPTAQGARIQGELCAKNILNCIKNKPLLKNNISNKGILIDLGGSNCAIGKLFGINLSGKIALFLKKLIYSMHAKKFN